MLKTKYLEKGIKINSASRERNVKKGYGCKTRTWKEFFKVILTNMTSQSFSDTAEFLQFLSKSSGVQLNNRDVEQKAVHMRCLCLDIPEQESLSSGSKCNLEVLAIISSEFRGFLKKIKDKGVWQSYVGLPRLPVFVSFANQQFAEKDAKIKFHRISMGFFTKKVNITENESIHATITEHRRITLRNVMRWSQQILTSMNCLHKNYITLTPVSLHEVYLQSDWPIVRGIWEITRSKTAPRKKNEDPHRNIPRGNGGRQAWLDITHGGIAQPKNSVEDFSNHENSNHFYVELRKMDSLGSGILTLKPTDNADKRDGIIRLYTEYISGLQNNLRDLGIIVMQLVARRVFTENELKYWKQWTFPLDNNHFRHTDIASDTDSVGSSSKKSDHDRSINTQFVQKQVELRLQDICPAILDYPMEFRSILSLCFFPPCAPEVLEQEVKRGVINTIIRSPLLKSVRKVCSLLEDTISAFIDDGQFVKQSLWTEEDEENRIEKQLARSRFLHAKARDGVHAAAVRIRTKNEQTWWHMQSDQYRAKMERRKQIQQEAEQKRKVHKHLIVQASLHWWDEDRIKMWLRSAFQKYYSQIVQFHQNAEQMKPRKPEIYVRRLIEEIYETFDDFYVEKILLKFSHGLEDFYNKLQPGLQTATRKKDNDDEKQAVPFSLEMLSKQERVDYCAKMVFDQLSYRLSRRSHPLRMTKLFRNAKLEEVDAINKIGDKLLITSEEQLFYKKLSLCCDYTVGLFSELKDVVKEFHQELQIVDRQKAKRICIVLSSAALAQFEREDSTRARGEHEAAFRICAFFRLIHAKVILVPAAKERKEMQIAVDTMVVQEETAISEEPILPVPEPPMEPAKCTTRIISIHSADDSSAELVLTIFVDGIDQRFHDEWMALKCSAFKKLVSVVQEEHCPVLSSPSTSEEQERLVLLLKGPTQYYYDQYGNFADFFKSKPDQYELRSESPVESVLESNASNFISCKCTIRTGKLIAGVNYKVSICFDKNLSESICLNFPQLKSSVEYSTRFDINPWLLRSHRADKELLELVLKNRLKLKPTFPSNIKGIQGRIVYWKDSQETCEGLGYRCYLNSDSQMVQGFEIITKLDWSQSIHDSPSHTLYELQRRIILVYNEISGENFLELTGWSGLDSKIADGKSVVKSVSRCECFDSLKISPLEFNAHVGKFIASYVGSNFSSIVSSTNTINSGFGEYIDTEVVLALDYQIRVRNSQGVGSFFNKSSLRISLGSIFLERNHLIEKGKVNLPKMNVAYFKLHNKVVQSPLQQSEVVLENAVAEKSQDQKWGISLQFLQAQSPLLK